MATRALGAYINIKVQYDKGIGQGQWEQCEEKGALCNKTWSLCMDKE